MILLFILISLFCGFIPYNNHDAIFSLIITLGIPILFFALKDYSFENVIIKDRLKKIFNFNFFISNILIFLIYFILKKDNGFINLFLREYILTTNLIFFTFLWAMSLKSLFMFIFNKDDLIKSKLSNYEKEIPELLLHSLKNRMTKRIQYIIEYVILNFEEYSLYNILEIIKQYPSIENLDTIIKLYDKIELKSDKVEYIRNIITEIYPKLNKIEKNNIDKTICKLNNSNIDFIKRYSFLFICMNLNEMESSMLYKNILSINIKNNLKKMIATEEGTLTLYYFFESTILSKEITEKEMADGFIELLDTIQSPILMSKYRNKRKEIFLNINLLTSLFLYSKGNKLTNLDYCKVLSKAMNFKISEDEYNDYIYIFKEIFTDKNNYNNIYGMGNFLNEISKRYNIKLNISLQNGFNWNFLRIKPELIEAKSIKNEDTFSHIIGMLFFLVVRKFDNIRLFNNDIYPIYTKNLRCIANSIFGEDKYILSFFYDYIYKNGVVKYYIQKRENQEYYTLKKSEPNSDFIYLEEFEDKVKKKDYSL